MRKGIHPKWHPEAKVLVDGQVVMTVGSTQPEIRVEIWSGTHPFYTGTQRLVDTEGQVDRFLRKLQRREAIRSEQENKQEKKSPINLEVKAMALGVRAEKALEEAGVVTVGDLVELMKKGEDALLAIPGVGQKALIDIRRYLRAEGLI